LATCQVWPALLACLKDINTMADETDDDLLNELRSLDERTSARA
jgi:hypothetical protein